MSDVVLVTEGDGNRQFLQTLLRAVTAERNVEVVAAKGWSSADALARSYLMASDARVALIVDADSNDDEAVRQRQRFLERSLGAIGPPDRWVVIVLRPHLEGEILSNPRVFEMVAGRPLTQADQMQAKLEPKRLLIFAYGANGLTAALPDHVLRYLAQMPPFSRLVQFVGERPPVQRMPRKHKAEATV